MKLGLLTDIHSHSYHLQAALEILREKAVDQIVVIGDVADTFGRGQGLAATCRLLAEAKAIGVWGNHDYGLCVEPSEVVLNRYPPSVFDFLKTLRPRLEIGGCHFMHTEPWLNPESISDLWYGNDTPEGAVQLARVFAAVPNRMMFSGHYHSWLVATPKEVTPWDGSRPITLEGGRYFVVINALCDGHFATYDTESGELIPYNNRAGSA